MTEHNGFDPISFVAGVVQTALYLDFFYVYFTRLVACPLPFIAFAYLLNLEHCNTYVLARLVLNASIE